MARIQRLPVILAAISAVVVIGCGSSGAGASRRMVSEPLSFDRSCRPTMDTVCPSPLLLSVAPAGDRYLAIWSREAVGPETGVYARLVDARSGAPVGQQVEVSDRNRVVSARGVVTSIVAAYNPGTREFLVLWQAGPGSGRHYPEIHARRLDADLHPLGAVVRIAPHGFYLRDVAANPENGEYLLVQSPEIPEARARVAAIRLGRDGSAKAVSTWGLDDPAPQIGVDRVHVAYDESTHGYLVAWLRTVGVPGLATRRVDADGRHLSVARQAGGAGLPSEAGQFTLGCGRDRMGCLLVWTAESSQGARTLVAQRLANGGEPAGPTIKVSNTVDRTVQLKSPIQAVVSAGDRYILSWHEGRNLRVSAIPADNGPAQPSRVVELPNDPTRAIATAVSSSAQTLLILSLDDRRSGPNQVFAQVESLQH
jgi:hypothetical protein